MIVTRQRRKPFPYRKIFLPLLAIALVAFALAWGPSRSILTAGPMAPAWRTAGIWWNVAAAPFHFAAQNQTITNLNRQVATLQSQVTAAQSTASDKDKRIADLQQQIGQLQAQAASARSGAAPHAPSQQTAANGAAAFGQPTGQGAGSDLSAGATADLRRTAQYWAAMDPENAAKVAQHLPATYVARVLAQMQPDAVGAILDALPAAYAAKLTQEHPDLQR